MDNAEIQLAINKIHDDTQILGNGHIYELEKKKGTPKCSTLANRIDSNLQCIIDGYENMNMERKEAADKEQFDTLTGMLRNISNEFEVLSKKQPDTLLNPFKVRQVNRILKQLKEIMKDELFSQFLELVQEENGKGVSRNSYSDVTVILCQYKEACSEYRDKYYKPDALSVI